MAKVRGKFGRLWDWVFNPAFFSVQMLVVMVGGGLLAAYLMRPEMDAGPVRVTTFIVLSLSSAILARRYIKMVRRNLDGMATLLVVASCWVWVAWAMTAAAILYLIIARAWGLWPEWGESFTERITYFFISGTALAVAYKALTFETIPDEALIGRRVSAWPFTIFNRRNTAESRHQAEHEKYRGAAQDERDVRQDARTKRQSERGKAQDERGVDQDQRERRFNSKD